MSCTGTSCNQGRTECRDGCHKLFTDNSDGTSPHTDTKETVEFLLDGALALALVAALVVTVFTAIGFWK